MRTYLATQHTPTGEEILLGSSTSEDELRARVKRELVIEAMYQVTSLEKHKEIKLLFEEGESAANAITAIMGEDFWVTIQSAVVATWGQIIFEAVD